MKQKSTFSVLKNIIRNIFQPLTNNNKNNDGRILQIHLTLIIQTVDVV